MMDLEARIARAAAVGRGLLMPQAESFFDLFDRVGPLGLEPGGLSASGRYCRVERGGRLDGCWVVPHPAVLAKSLPLDARDRVSYAVIVWEKEGVALVRAVHGVALIESWIALIDPATIPDLTGEVG